jgi:hypothetical protein
LYKRKGESMNNPTAEYDALSQAFSFFNGKLFDGRLPPVLITLNKRGRALGYYRNRAYVSRVMQGMATDEIALCANTFSGRADKDVLSTLVHEMAHLWQFSFGKRVPKRAYHNLEWAHRMMEVGLNPSDTGAPGGNIYGYSMTHFVIDGGPFDRAAGDLLGSGWRLNWEERLRFPSPGLSGTGSPADGNQTRKKFVCLKCGMAAWAKFTASLVCGTCGIAMI